MTLSSLRRGALAGALCTLAVALLSIGNETWFGAEWLMRDWMHAHLAAFRPPDPRIVVVAISEQAAANLADLYGRPNSYSREVYALAIDELRRDGASVIALDLLFAEENPAAPEGDRELARAAADAPVILGAQTVRGGAARPATAWEQKLWTVGGPSPAGPMQAITPHPMFAGAAGTGTMRLASSRYSEVIHQYALIDKTYSGWMPSLGLETARQFLGLPRHASVVSGRLRIGDLSVPLASGDMNIRWNGRKADFRDPSYQSVGLDKVILAALLRQEDASNPKLATFAEQFREKIVLIGLTSTGSDIRATPLSPTTAGVEIHANAIDNLINRDFNTVVSRWAVFPLIMLLAAGFGILLDRTRSQLVAAILALAAIAVVLAVCFGALAAGWIVPTFGAVASLALTYVSITVINLVAEQVQTAVLRHTFGRYVSPQILEHILAHPEKVELGGERRDLTILFSDIRGFTSISEASEPEEVVEMLNEYLTRMVEILLEHGGTLDKFIGDAVMGFWNAPAADPDHPIHAVACAVQMIHETARIRARWEQEGKASIRIGIGINSGEAVVGNIGAEKVFGYTVIGDAVNLASRLESKNKDYGTEIIVSEFTLARIGSAFETVYLDEVKVKGKEKAVKIYEVKPNYA